MTRRTAHMAVDGSAVRDLGPLIQRREQIAAARIGGTSWEDIARALSEQTGRQWTADEIERFVTERGAA